jgi:hypothetical protein
VAAGAGDRHVVVAAAVSGDPAGGSVNQRTLGWALMAVGAVAVVGGVLWLVADDDEPVAVEETTTTEPSTTESSTTEATTTTAPSTTTTTAPPAETPEQFFTLWVAALSGGDADFLVGRLHPTVFERYDQAACQQYLGGIDAPAAEAEVLSVGDTVTWSWETDGLARDIPDATTVRVRRTEDGDTFIENDTHVVIGADGLVRWFTDCGTPKEGAA